MSDEDKDARIVELEKLVQTMLSRVNRDDIYKHDLVALAMDGAVASEGCHTDVGTTVRKRLADLEDEVAYWRALVEYTELLTWNELADLVERAERMRGMFRSQRDAYAMVVEELREPPLAGRRCTGCGGSILQRPIELAREPGADAVTFGYDCTCPGVAPLDKSLPWEPVPERASGIVFRSTSASETSRDARRA